MATFLSGTGTSTQTRHFLIVAKAFLHGHENLEYAEQELANIIMLGTCRGIARGTLIDFDKHLKLKPCSRVLVDTVY